jgi:hypothetical protein
MNSLNWIGQAALAIFFLVSGTLKLFASTHLMQAFGHRAHIHITMAPLPARILGLIELVLAFGVLMPDIYAADGVIPEFVIARFCATGLAILMVAMAIYHARRKEHAALDVAVFLLALFVIVGRWPF